MVDGLALGVVALGVLAAVGVGVLAGLRAGVAVLLDFLLAAGLLRLTASLGWTAIAGIAVIVAVRQVVSRGLGLSRDPVSLRPASGRRP